MKEIPYKSDICSSLYPSNIAYALEKFGRCLCNSRIGHR